MAEDPAQLAQRAESDVGHVVEHPGGDRAVEDPVAERQVLDVADAARRPRARCVSSTIRCDWSTRDRPGRRALAPSARRARPGRGRPRGRSCGCTSATASNATSPRVRARGSVLRDARLPRRRGRRLVRVLASRTSCRGSLSALTSLDDRRAREARRPGALPPSHAFTVAPTSANSPPRGSRPLAFLPVRRSASSSACSREWSVDGVVGSQPWSEVMISRSPGRSASSRSGSRRSKSWRQRWKLIGSFRCPQSMSVSTRLVKTNPSSSVLEQLLGARDALHVRLRRVALVDVAAGEDVARSSRRRAPVTPASRSERQVVRPARLEREVVPVRRALVVPRLADERPGDHPADGVLAREDLARDAAGVVELLERDRLLVRGDLEDGVGRRVDDPLAGLLVLLAELLDDLRPRRRPVAEHAAARCGA